LDETLLLKQRQPTLQPLGQIFRPALRVLPVETCLLSRALFFLQFEGPRVPIVDFLLEARAHLLLYLVDLRQASRFHIRNMPLSQFNRCEANGSLFQVGAQPVFVEKIASQSNFIRLRRSKIKMRCYTRIRRIAILADGSELEFFRDNMGLASRCRTPILDGMLQQEQSRQVLSQIGIIDKDRTTFHEVVVLFADKADHSLQKWVTRTHKRSNRLLVDATLLEADTLILLLNRRTGPGLTVTLSNIYGYMSNFPAAFFPPFDLPALSA
jgi:hypothetical protein